MLIAVLGRHGSGRGEDMGFAQDHLRVKTKWSLYLIRTREGSLYTGIATDVARRFAEHQTGGDKCARYLRGRSPLKLVFERKIGSRSLALRVERQVKSLPKTEKEGIVRRKPTAKDLLSQLGILDRES